MRGALLACVLAVVGCGGKDEPSKPTVGAKGGDPKEPKVKSEKKEPPKKEPEVRIKLADARVKILNLNKAGVRSLLGPPDATNSSMFNGVNTIVWVYDHQRVVWNPDTEKYYPVLAISFYEKIDGSDPGNAIEVRAN